MAVSDFVKPVTLRMAPGPPGHWLFGHLAEFRADVLGLMMEATRNHGDVVRFRLGQHVVHLLNHPDHVHHVLQRHAENFDKATRSTRFIRKVAGDSLLTANGEFWRRQRRLVQPAFHGQQIGRFVDTMARATGQRISAWCRREPSDDPLDVAAEMSQLTFGIAGLTLFSADVGPAASAIEHALRIILPHTFGQLGRLWNGPSWLPTPANRRFRRALADVDRTVYQIINDHRQSSRQPGEEPRDLLDMIMQARDETTGEALNDVQLRNETTTFLLAGHETTANALTWTFHLLATHADVAAGVREEARSVFGGRPPALDDINRLTLTRRVIQESMRLFPPIWIIERRVIAEDHIAGFRLPAGSAVVISPFALHRHPAFWSCPDVFDPARFETPPPAAYLPFGAGPRFCIGREFALMEALVITAMVMQSVELVPVRGHPVEPWPGITLRTRFGLPMWVRPLA